MYTQYLMENTPTRQINAKVELFVGTTLAEIITQHDKLISITINRIGEEGKFFGFGISQKVTVEFFDHDRKYKNLADFSEIRVAFNDAKTFPIFFVKPQESKRDEKTNKITLVGYDKLEEAKQYTYSELSLIAYGYDTEYTLSELANAIAGDLELEGMGHPTLNNPDFWDSIVYNDGINQANLDGTETYKEVLDAIAEATQTIYYIDGEDCLKFKSLYAVYDGDIEYHIDKSQYFEFEGKSYVTIRDVASITELGNNVASNNESGVIQYVRDNPFVENYSDLAYWLECALENISGLTIYPITCTWRGQYALECGDIVLIEGKKGGLSYACFIINDTITYNGGLKQVTSWSYGGEQAATANPSTLGEVLKQTYAKVDKANRQIELLASETSSNKENISALRIDTESISGKVSSLEEQANKNNGEIETLKTSVETAITAEGVQVLIQSELDNGVTKVQTETGYKLDNDGLTVSKSGSEMETTISEDGMTVAKSGTDVLTANSQGVNAANLHATTYLIVGKNSRFEDYGNRTGCFWIGG